MLQVGATGIEEAEIINQNKKSGKAASTKHMPPLRNTTVER
jgi:hypothetical protein